MIRLIRETVMDFHRMIFDRCTSNILRVTYFILLMFLIFTAGFILSPICYIYDFWQENDDIADSIRNVWNWNERER